MDDVHTRRIIYFGTPTFATIPLRGLVANGYRPVLVVTQPDRPSGRRRVLTPPPVKEVALELGLPVFQPATLRDRTAIATIVAAQPEIGIIAAYGAILRPAILQLPPLGYLNIHPSLLPRHRGPSPVAGAILAGDRETGVTVMQLHERMDSGPVVAQIRRVLDSSERTGPLTDELFSMGTRLLLDVLPGYMANQSPLMPQDEQQATFSRMLSRNDGMINWAQPAFMIDRMIRAYDPWPGTYTTWQGRVLKILHVRMHDTSVHGASPGVIIACGDDGPLVATSVGILELCQVQPAGKRSMLGREWARGQRRLVGECFGAEHSAQ